MSRDFGRLSQKVRKVRWILGARANAERLEDSLGIMLGDGKAALGRLRSAVQQRYVQSDTFQPPDSSLLPPPGRNRGANARAALIANLVCYR